MFLSDVMGVTDSCQESGIGHRYEGQQRPSTSQRYGKLNFISGLVPRVKFKDSVFPNSQVLLSPTSPSYNGLFPSVISVNDLQVLIVSSFKDRRRSSFMVAGSWSLTWGSVFK